MTSAMYKLINALIELGCVKAYRPWQHGIADIKLVGRYSTYQLSRQELWINRVVSFISGVAVTVVATILLHVLQ